MSRKRAVRSDSPCTLAVLRERTAQQHAQLEHSQLILPATRDRARYGRLIGAMLAFHRTIEREFKRYEPLLHARGLDMTERYRADELKRESALFADSSAPQAQLEFESAAQAAGGVYVMEGSTLGGMVIAHSVRRHLEHESRYYGAYGARTSQRWRETCAQLDAFPQHAEDVEAMAEGANRTFAALHRHLSCAML